MEVDYVFSNGNNGEEILFDGEVPVSATEDLSEIEKYREFIEKSECQILDKNGKSEVWKIFGVIKHNDVIIKDYYVCKICKYICKKTSTSNLMKHSCFVRENRQNIPKSVIPSADVKLRMLKACVRWTVADVRPFYAIEGNGFKDLIRVVLQIGSALGKNVDVDELLPHPTTISRNIASEAEENAVKVREEINECVRYGCGITSDLWKETHSNEAYVSITIHYIKNDRISERVLSTEPIDSTTADSVNTTVLGVLKKFGFSNARIEKCVFTTDRGSNMVAAFRNRISCSNHLLHNVVEKSLKDVPQIMENIDKCKSLAKYFRKATLNKNLSQGLQNDTPTRWNSTFHMISSITRNWTEVGRICFEKNQSHRLVGINNDLLIQTCSILEKFEIISVKMESTQKPTLHLAITSINYLKRVCNISNDDHPDIQSLKIILNNNIDRIWNTNLSDYHRIAFFLYPPTNKMIIFTEEEKSSVKTSCAEILKEIIDDEEINGTASLTTSHNNTADDMFYDSFLDGLVNDNNNAVGEDRILKEIDEYATLSVSKPRGELNILQWWNNKQETFPLLCRLSNFIFSLPVSSAASERSFSSAKHLITDKRTSLDPHNVSNIMFLNNCYKKGSESLPADESHLR